jgi:hypothetical protein
MSRTVTLILCNEQGMAAQFSRLLRHRRWATRNLNDRTAYGCARGARVLGL